MDAAVTFDDARVNAAMNRLLAFGENPAPALAAIGQALARSNQARTRDGVTPEGVPFAPLKVRKGVPLNDTGTHIVGPLHSAPDGANAVVVGVPVWWGVVHQFGSVARHIPARPFLGVSQDDERSIRALLTAAAQGEA